MPHSLASSIPPTKIGFQDQKQVKTRQGQGNTRYPNLPRQLYPQPLRHLRPFLQFRPKMVRTFASLPGDLSGYDFIFLDSVNRLGLTPDGLNQLRIKNASKSFIFVFQTSKPETSKGSQSFQHDVDVMIEVLEKGKAVEIF
jgi:hypothetical protein